MDIDESTVKQYVRELINFYASSSIRTRGNAIYRKNNVDLVSYDEKDDLFELSVLGNHRYKVYVRGLRSLNAQTSCTCPYTWGMCKHSVAALKFLASKGESVFQEKKSEPVVQKAKSKGTQKNRESLEKKTLPKEGFEIQNWQHLEQAVLRDALPSTIEYYNAIKYYGGLTVSGIKWTKNRLTREEGMAVAYIANSKSPDLLELVFSGKLDIWKKEILEEYGLAGKKFNDYFELGFSYKEGPFYLVREEFNGLLPVKNREENAFTGLVREINQSSETLEWLSLKTARQRQLSVNRFQDNADLRMFLISLKAGGTGINLTAADYVYVVDPWWNPAVENQAIDRCYRIGQDKNVFAYRMICTNTVEEKILQLQQEKKKIATDIIQTDESIMKNLSVKDIESLFS